MRKSDGSGHETEHPDEKKAHDPDETRGSIEDRAEEWIGDSAQLPAVYAANSARVEKGFWTKIRRVARRIPFTHDLLAAYYCASDPDTPFRVRATLIGALAYFVLPIDMIPDFLLTVGFGDDATVLAAALSMVAAHIKPAHRKQAADTLADDPALADAGGEEPERPEDAANDAEPETPPKTSPWSGPDTRPDA